MIIPYDFIDKMQSKDEKGAGVSLQSSKTGLFIILRKLQILRFMKFISGRLE